LGFKLYARQPFWSQVAHIGEHGMHCPFERYDVVVHVKQIERLLDKQEMQAGPVKQGEQTPFCNVKKLLH
jgi:hypothetical protein